MKRAILILALALCPAWVLATTSEEYYMAGLQTLKEKDYEKAVKYFRAALDQKADYWQAYHYMGVAFYQMGNRTEALVAMQESLKLNPNNPELRKFMKKVKKSGPWLATDSWTVTLALAAFLLSFLTAGWTGYWSWKLKPWKKGSLS